jgi:hypothetical protein
MNEAKEKALKAYKEAKAAVSAEYNEENFKKFCDAKRNCMLLGVRI